MANQYLEPTIEAGLHREAIRLCVADLQKCFVYVEPHQDNLGVFSHRFFELLLRSCTEFESLSKSVMDGLEMERPKKSDIKDYYALNAVYSLGECSALHTKFNGGFLILKPFVGWTDQKTGPFWYKSYNDVKHSRREEFKQANLVNVLNAVSANLILMVQAYRPGFLGSTKSVRDVNQIETDFFPDLPFRVCRPFK